MRGCSASGSRSPGAGRTLRCAGDRRHGTALHPRPRIVAAATQLPSHAWQQVGRPPQTDVRAKVTLSQTVRKIEIALTYNYTDSNGPAEHYTYNEFTASVTRAFDIK